MTVTAMEMSLAHLARPKKRPATSKGRCANQIVLHTRTIKNEIITGTAFFRDCNSWFCEACQKKIKASWISRLSEQIHKHDGDFFVIVASGRKFVALKKQASRTKTQWVYFAYCNTMILSKHIAGSQRLGDVDQTVQFVTQQVNSAPPPEKLRKKPITACRVWSDVENRKINAASKKKREEKLAALKSGLATETPDQEFHMGAVGTVDTVGTNNLAQAAAVLEKAGATVVKNHSGFRFSIPRNLFVPSVILQLNKALKLFPTRKFLQPVTDKLITRSPYSRVRRNGKVEPVDKVLLVCSGHAPGGTHL